MSISQEEVKKVANLARLEISEQEEQEFGNQLNAILEYFDQLSELDTDEVEPTTRAIDVSNIMRSDAQTTYEDRESLLDNAPSRDDDFFRVPKIMG
ncbi:Asp-tRNA(Asn)/Glu-tRNA(Gln) amidotransferase subunit GatC [Cyanobacterium stanieri LEGE 03274]|uniref:Aspartyl/glutamyl-tRNA(Asn/Gln) amidotransferase subunit C n=1 Tax=Cyanobacterium stanieri LEGE 03274 TaxID=1828756 RepID=A0ABR9V1F8_9CHRO|nr:Asp-tRNA(Asn)/Glu-tRNA(Gln) amidotransferase subunit GatC [Cyanobacterium stanieri]MBE9221725.1 Asp-tRNA(Asn)/Glu-tRNA(Gln) amidotransferase subunit GatC [Cyanobacterium stanieri LEGE 03274]